MIQHELYLSDQPDTLSRRIVAPCSSERLVLSIAGMDFSLAGLSVAQRERARREYEQVIVETETTQPFELTVFEAGPAWFQPIDLTGSEYRVALSHDADGAWASGLGFLARLERGPRPNMKLWVETANLDRFEGALINALRPLVAYCLFARGGLVLHSAAIESKGRAHVFFGPSGAGKSTLSRISAETGRTVISDELNALVPARGGFEVRALPFAGDFGRTVVESAAVPLGGLFRLKQAREHALTELPKAVALATLIAACPYVNSDPEISEGLLDLVQRVIERLRPRELSFALDPEFWQLVHTQHLP